MDSREELKGVVIQLCQNMGFSGRVFGASCSRVFCEPSLGFKVEVADPVITFKIFFSQSNDVYIVDLMRRSSDLMVSLNHPMSINKIESFIRTLKESKKPREPAKEFRPVLDNSFGGSVQGLSEVWRAF